MTAAFGPRQQRAVETQPTMLAARAIKALRTYGPRRAVQAALSLIEDWWFDLCHGTQTGGPVPLAELDVHGDNKRHGIDYQPTRVRAFRKLLATLNIPPGGVLVDFGSGKGRILMLAACLGFARIVGVEFSPALCRRASLNLLQFRRHGGQDTPVEIVQGDVVEYAVRDDENVLFLFNPFDDVVMGRVLEQIRHSLARRPRKVWLIYHVPVWRQMIERGPFRLAREFVYGSCEFAVFTNDLAMMAALEPASPASHAARG